MKRLSLLFLSMVLVSTAYSQCYDDNCDDDNDISVPGCCTGTTLGATWSGYGDINCVNMGTTLNPDVWVSFTAPSTGYIEVTIDNITQDGPTQFVVFDHQNAEVCSSLNSFGLLAGNGCHDLPGDGVGGTTSIDTVEYPVEIGERYWILVSADVENGATPGSFEVCVDLVPLPPPPPPAPGQDCVDAQVMCSESSTGFYNGQLDLGDGNVEENAANGWSSCLGDETSSQWYTFTASESGTIEMMLSPDTYNSTTQSGDDFDWEIYDITSSGCTNAAVSLACDYSGCDGTTGFSATGAGGFGQVGPTDFQNNNPAGPADCRSAPQWNTTSVNLTAGNTYALIIQNYTGSTGGVTVDFQGTSVIAPQQYQAVFNAVLDQGTCEATLTIITAAIPNYTYSWDYGDGTSATGSNPGSHYYGTPGTYIVELTMTDPLGCSVSSTQVVDVAICTPIPLPAGLVNFNVAKEYKRVLIDWMTDTEVNNDYFIIERSSDNAIWEPLIKVDGAGTSSDEHYYKTVDQRPLQGVNYYRLKQVDFNGTHTYSPVRTVKFDNKLPQLLKIVNVNGQEVDKNYRGIVFYMYDNGTSETVIQ